MRLYQLLESVFHRLYLNESEETGEEKIARLRKEKGWNQVDLARKAGISGSLIHKIELGKVVKPSSKFLLKIANALGVDLSELDPSLRPKEDEDVGEKVARLRKEKGWNQVDLAKRSGFPKSTICQVETGERKPRPQTLFKIANALGIDLSEFDPSLTPKEDEDVGEKVARLRKEKGWSQSELNRRAGVSAIQRIEKTHKASPKSLLKIANALGIDPSELSINLEKPEDINTLGKKVEQQREEKGWSQSGLAEKAGVKVLDIIELEMDQHIPGSYNLRRILELLDMNPAEHGFDKSGVSIGGDIEKIRLEKNIGRDELAEKAGVDYLDVVRLENGTAIPRKNDLFDILNALDIDPSEYGLT